MLRKADYVKELGEPDKKSKEFFTGVGIMEVDQYQYVWFRPYGIENSQLLLEFHLSGLVKKELVLENLSEDEIEELFLTIDQEKETTKAESIELLGEPSLLREGATLEALRSEYHWETE